MTNFQRPIAVMILSFVSLFALAQQYGNEWIDFSKTYYAFDIDEDGLYRIPYETLQSSGINLDPEDLRLFNRGTQVPIYISDMDDFGAGDFIEFVGERNDGYFDTQLYENPEWQPNDDASLFSDASRYYLVSSAAIAGLNFTEVNNELGNIADVEEYFIHKSRTSFANIFNRGRAAEQGWTAIRVSFSDFEEGEGFMSLTFDSNPYNTNLITQGLNTSADVDATIAIKYAPQSNTTYTFGPDHHIQVSVNDNVVLDHSQNGTSIVTLSDTFSSSLLGDPVSSFKIENIDDLDIDPQDGDYKDKGSIAYVDYSYPRNFSFANSSFFPFELDNTSPLYFEATDFDGGSNVALYDLNNLTRQVAFQSNGNYPYNLAASSAARNLVLASLASQEVKVISALSSKTFIDYSDPANIGDFVMVYHPQLKEGPVDEIERYHDYRSSPEGGNHQILMADINDLYDQFSHGIQKHPLSIQNFTNYIFDQAQNNNWPIRPEYLLLLGRAIVYNDARDPNEEKYAANLVPTYGNNGSDNLLSAKKGLNHLPLLATGRISALESSSVGKYLDKLIVYEALINEQQECSKEARAWMKGALHLGGGYNLAEADQFRGYLNGYEDIITESFMGTEVVATYVKDEIGLIETPPELIEYVDEGISVLTLFGHSNAEIFDFGLAAPEEYNNQGKYPFLMSNSCFIGNVHQLEQEGSELMALSYVVDAEEKGFIAFLATVGFGFPTFLDNFTSALFENATSDLYGAPLGKIIQATHTDVFFNDLEVFGTLSGGTLLHSEEFTLQGDPALSLYHFDRPEYLIEDNDITFNPPVPTLITENIELNFVVNNLGKAVSDSIDVLVEHSFPDGSTNILFSDKIPPVSLRDTVSLIIPNESSLFGINGIRIILDPENVLEEDCEDNNQFTKSLLVLSDQPTPLEPCDLAIVSDQDLTLKANTPFPIMESFNYLFQLDTSVDFDSPSLLEGMLTQVGGVLNWQPNVNYEDGQVYYWRVTRESSNPIWQTQSFVFRDNADEGWSQSENELLALNAIENMAWEDDLSHYTFDFGFNKGTIASPVIGPANFWSTLEWAAVQLQGDSTWVEVWSSDTADSGEPELLLSSEDELIDLSGIDAEAYPYISLLFVTEDYQQDSPAVLRNWQVFFEKTPELTFNQSINYAFNSDTLKNSAAGSFEIAVSNVNTHSTPAVETSCRIIGNDNSSQEIECPDLAAMDGLSDASFSFDFESAGLSGDNVLQIDLNPTPGFIEKHYFNNQINLPFHVISDIINPILDVSFDGVNILNNDLVSSNPEILIQILDENTVQALTDTSIAEIFLVYPSGAEEQISMNHPDLTFTPADINNLEVENRALINFNPLFTEDGFYTLRVKAADASGNQSSQDYDYVITFEVVTTNSISNVVNYPNPFTTSTQFVYTLAGNEIPTVFRIQVMAPGGQVVREFSEDELGVPRFGKNISDFVWDGTDTYGNELANGVYFFRVIANTSSGEALELYSNDFTKSVDDSFGKYSIGKMYKMR